MGIAVRTMVAEETTPLRTGRSSGLWGEIKGMSGYLNGGLKSARGLERVTTSWVSRCLAWGGGRLRDVLSCPLNQAVNQPSIYHSKLLGTFHLAYQPAVPR